MAPWHPLYIRSFQSWIVLEPNLCQPKNGGFGIISSRAFRSIFGRSPHHLGCGAIEKVGLQIIGDMPPLRLLRYIFASTEPYSTTDSSIVIEGLPPTTVHSSSTSIH